MTPDEYCQQRAARSGSSFYYSFMFLPPPRRQAITALYAFCREVDDAVDEARDREVAATRLRWWRSELAALFAGQPTHPVTRALQQYKDTFGLRHAQLEEVIDGMQMDLHQRRYPDFEALRVYCRRAAGVVGELSAQIFGTTSPATLQYADRLGLAFQLTNIIRDVGEDARNGRIYLPLDEMEAAGVREQQVTGLQPGLEQTAAWQTLMASQAGRARRCYREAYELLPEADLRAQRPGLMMAAIYSTLLDEIERDRFQVLSQRTALTPLRKLWLAWRVRVSGRPPALRG